MLYVIYLLRPVFSSYIDDFLDLEIRIFTLQVFSATMNVRKILTSIFPWRNIRDVWAGCSGGCSEYRPVLYLKTDIS